MTKRRVPMSSPWFALALGFVAAGACHVGTSGEGTGAGGAGAASGGGGAGALGGGGAGGDGGAGGGSCDPASCPAAQTACQTPSCDGNAHCAFTPEPARTACHEGSGTLCNGAGACVECLVSGDCTSPTLPVCQSGLCVPAHCDNLAYDPGAGESDVDCGGPDCPDCENNRGCNAADDCQSYHCIFVGGGGAGGAAPGICGPCSIDVDCASGETCTPSHVCAPKLADGAGCSAPNACLSDHCTDGVCCATACGGTCEACDVPAALGTCTPYPAGIDPEGECAPDTCGGASRCRCQDQARDGAESARDCGGGVCAPCANGFTCDVGADCATGICQGGFCNAASCGDGFVDAGEACDGDGSGAGGETATCDADCSLVTCDDGHVNGLGGESCDDGATVPGDGCSATCTVEPGFSCDGSPSVCTPL